MDLQFLLADQPAPDDIDIGTVRRACYNADWWRRLCEHYPNACIHVKYLDGSNVADRVTVGTMRRGVAEGRIVISIDDGNGGQLEDA